LILRGIAVSSLLTLSLSAIAQESAPDLSASVAKQLPALTETYKHLHRNPELSHFEVKTSAYMADELRKAGFTVTEHIGRYEDGSAANGIVAVMENGPGPRLLIRTELDALPVEEKTGLDYASSVKATDSQGQQVGVMHACGHDIHMTVALGTARELSVRKQEWHGTLMIVGQPAEETIDGARAMLADGLYERFGKPDFVLSEHDSAEYPAGTIAIKGGPLTASSTSIDVTMRGVGAHGAMPQNGKDPIWMAAEFVVQAQAIVSRQIDPQQPAVLTVGKINGGTKRNIIPDEVTMGLTLRTFSDPVRDAIIADIRRTADGIATGYGVPADRMPLVSISKPETAPETLNDSALAERMRKPAVAALGQSRVVDARPIMASEDVGYFQKDGTIPGMMFFLGASDADKLAQSQKTGVPLPGPHSPLFAPVYTPTIETGVTAMSAMALNLLGSKR
jgi:hippurate hydrolase